MKKTGDGRKDFAEATGRLGRLRSGSILGWEKICFSLIDNAPVGIFASSLRGEFLYANKALAEMMDFESLEGMMSEGVLARYKNGKDREAYLQALRREGKLDTYELDLVTKTGEARTVLISAAIEEDVLSGIIMDITGRKKTEDALRASEERYRTLVQTAGSVILVLSPDHRVIEFNQAAEDLYGVSREEVLGKNYMELFLPESVREKVAADIDKVLRGEPTLGFENPVAVRDGKEHILLWNARRLLDPSGLPFGIVAIGQDITERKRIEKRLEEAVSELGRSNAELEQFAYVASHDLKEPLLAMASDIKLLERRIKGRLNQEVDELVSDALAEAMRMQAFITDLLSYSRAGTHGGSFEATECSAVLDQALANLKLAIEESGAEITHDPLPIVTADPVQLVQLLQNLLSNAIKFRGEGKPGIHISAERAKGEWVFSIKDNGIGIPPEQRERVFELFHRLHKEGYQGSGIGLATCRKIADHHGGRIWVESEPGRGSTFYFTIPDRTE